MPVNQIYVFVSMKCSIKGQSLLINSSWINKYREKFLGPFRCSKCYMSFNNIQYLKVHTGNKHRTIAKKRIEETNSTVICPKCPREYVHLQSMQRHAKMVHGLSVDEVRNENDNWNASNLPSRVRASRRSSKKSVRTIWAFRLSSSDEFLSRLPTIFSSH